jgi:hypothetical protein
MRKMIEDSQSFESPLKLPDRLETNSPNVKIAPRTEANSHLVSPRNKEPFAMKPVINNMLSPKNKPEDSFVTDIV